MYICNYVSNIMYLLSKIHLFVNNLCIDVDLNGNTEIDEKQNEHVEDDMNITMEKWLSFGQTKKM